MEMDIGANDYPFQCFLCLLMLKLPPSFHKSQKLYFELQITGKYIL